MERTTLDTQTIPNGESASLEVQTTRGVERASRRITQIKEWLESNRGHQDTQDVKLELTHYSFMRRALTTNYTPLLHQYMHSQLRMIYEPHSLRYCRRRDTSHELDASSCDSSSSAWATDINRQARLDVNLTSDENYRVFLLQQHGMQKDHDSAPHQAYSSPIYDVHASPTPLKLEHCFYLYVLWSMQ